MNKDQWRRVKNIFGEALELRPEDRPQFVIEACAGDGEIRRELEKLLGWFDSRFMEEPAVSEVADQFHEVDQFHPGQGIGHYRIERKLGAGGMGEVYLARDTKLDRMVAVKFLNGRFSQDREKLNRFIREAKATSSLNHPHIVTVHEVDEFDGSHFIATEYIDGETLRDRLGRRDEPMSLTSVLKIAIEVAEALSAAHQAGIVHRDIKPENIMIRKDGYAKVLDFGLAKLLTGMNPAEVSVDADTRTYIKTEPGTVMGTVTYMSPEQARGSQTDERTDIWSLGVVLYEMLAQKPPFEGETVSHTIVAILEAEPRSLEDVPDKLQRIVSKALSKNRDTRYLSAQDLVTDLKTVKRELEFRGELERSVSPDLTQSDGESRTAARSTDPEHLTDTDETTGVTKRSILEFVVDRVGEQKLAAGISIAVLLAAALTAGYFTLFSGAEREITSIAVLPFENKSGNPEIEYLTDGMTETLINGLSSIPSLNVKSRSSAFRYKGKKLEPTKIAGELNVEVLLIGQISRREELLVLNLELIDARTEDVLWGRKYERRSSELGSLQTEIALNVADKLRTGLSGAERQKVAKEYTVDPEAYRRYLQGLFCYNKGTAEDYLRSVEYFKQALEKDPEYALAYAGMALSYVAYSEFGVALSPKVSMSMAKAAALKAIELDDSLAEPHTALGVYLSLYAWDLEAADKELRLAIELNPRYATAHLALSHNLAFQGRFDESVEEVERAVELEPLSDFLRKEKIYILFLARQYDEVLALANEFQALFRGGSKWWMGRIHLARGNYKQAIAMFREVQKSDKRPHRSTLLACALARAGQTGEARKMVDDLERDWETQPEWQSQMDRAEVYAALGDKDKAFYWLDRMLVSRSNVTRVLVYPELDDLRNDPRFEDLKRRIALAKLN